MKVYLLIYDEIWGDTIKSIYLSQEAAERQLTEIMKKTLESSRIEEVQDKMSAVMDRYELQEWRVKK